MDSKKFGQFVAEIRKEKNMTQADLANIIGVTDKAISRWEKGILFLLKTRSQSIITSSTVTNSNPSAFKISMIRSTACTVLL